MENANQLGSCGCVYSEPRLIPSKNGLLADTNIVRPLLPVPRVGRSISITKPKDFSTLTPCELQRSVSSASAKPPRVHFRNCWLCVLTLPWRYAETTPSGGTPSGSSTSSKACVRRGWRFQISNNQHLPNLSPRRDCKPTSAIQQIPACPTQAPSELGWEFSSPPTCSLLRFPGGMATTICRLSSARSTWRKPFPLAFCRRKSRPASPCRS
jgi:hypothetical protein